MLLIFIVLLTVLLALSASLSASETSLFSLSPFLVRNYQASQDRKKQHIASLLKSPRDLLVTILIMNIFTNVLIQNVISSITVSDSWLFKVFLPLILTLVFGEIVPKSLALSNNVAIAHVVVTPLVLIKKALGPFRVALARFAGFLSHTIFIYIKREQPITAQELHHMLISSENQGIIEQEEMDLLRGYLHLTDSLVKEHMRPRGEVLSYSIGDPIDTLLHILVDKRCSRVPVCNKSLDKIIGIAYIGDLFTLEELTVKNLQSILTTPHYVAETTHAEKLLKDMTQKDITFSLVVDEFGTVTGLITKEDLIEGVIGDIRDVRDSKKLISTESSEVVVCNGKWEIADFEEYFDHKLEHHRGNVTIGGWLIEELGEIPLSGVKYVTDDFFFYVLDATPSYINKVYVRKLGNTDTDAEFIYERS